MPDFVFDDDLFSVTFDEVYIDKAMFKEFLEELIRTKGPGVVGAAQEMLDLMEE